MSTKKMRRLAWLLLLLAPACGDHYSTQEAYRICEELRQRIPTLAEAEAFAQCVACHEDCGEDCEQEGFTCPD